MTAKAFVAGVLFLAALGGLGACGGALNQSQRSSAAPVDVTRDANAQSAASAAYFEFQVEKPAREAAGSCAPKYPEGLRAARTTGEVQALFVVDTAGLAEPATFEVVRSTHAEFATAVRESLPCLRYRPASIEGRRVRQVVQQPFVFDLMR